MLTNERLYCPAALRLHGPTIQQRRVIPPFSLKLHAHRLVDPHHRLLCEAGFINPA